MATHLACLTLIIVLLVASGGPTTSARKDRSAGEYWRSVVKDQPLPEAIQSLVVEPVESTLAAEVVISDHHHKGARDVSNKGHVLKFTEEIEPEPQATNYDNGFLSSKFAKSVEPEPQVSNYDNGFVSRKFGKSVEPEPQLTNYDNGFVSRKFAKSVDPEPQVTNYDSDDEGSKKFAKDIELEPQVTNYGDTPNEFTKSIEREPQLTNYENGIKPAAAKNFIKSSKSHVAPSANGMLPAKKGCAQESIAMVTSAV